MKAVGIVAEYNPFHYGHLLHLERVKEISHDSVIILVLGGNFTQRGEASILTKWEKAQIALEYGVDLVVELPYSFATQSADFFTEGSVTILDLLKSEKIIFGSECNDINLLTKLAKLQLYSLDYQKKVNEMLKTGTNYPTALSIALLEESGSTVTSPNDLLGTCYIKAILKRDSKMEAISIQRTNKYHDETLNDVITSATSIRKALLENKDISAYVPKETFSYLKNKHIFDEHYFPFLKYKIMTTDDLSIYQTVDEGIENRLKKEIIDANSYDDFVKRVKTKRYTYNKIHRMCCHILCNFTKDKAQRFKNIEYIRVLGFSKKGQDYLSYIKKDLTVDLVTTFSKLDNEMLRFEQTVTQAYAAPYEEEEKQSLIHSEYKERPKKRS